MCRPSRPNYNQHNQSIFVNRHISHAIQRFSRQTTSQKAIPGQGTPLKLPSNLESIFLIQTVGTSRPLPSQRLSHLKQSPKPKSTRLHKTPLYRNTTHLAIQQTCNGNMGHQQVFCLCLLDISAAFDTLLTTPYLLIAYRLYLESLEPSFHGSSCTSSHALSLSMSLVTHLIRKPSPVMFLKVLFSAPFCSFFTRPHSAN